MTRNIMLAALLLMMLGFSCSAQQQTTERRVPQCLSLCGNQFAACTEEYPGDASACLPARRDCEQACEAERAVQRMEDGRRGLQAPIDTPMLRPDAGSVAPDAGSAPDSPDSGAELVD